MTFKINFTNVLIKSIKSFFSLLPRAVLQLLKYREVRSISESAIKLLGNMAV